MNRRSFLGLLTAGVVGYELDLDKLLWIPGQKKIFIPSGIKLKELDVIVAELTRLQAKMRGYHDNKYHTPESPEIVFKEEYTPSYSDVTPMYSIFTGKKLG